MRFEALDAFRGLAALAIIVVHVRPYIPVDLFPTDDQLYLLVDFFFVLSGFVMCHAYGSRLKTPADLSDYAIRRVGRLWPLHLVTLGVMVFAEVAIEAVNGLGVHWISEGYDLGIRADLIEQVLLLNSFNLTELSWNVPSWSIGAEMISYVAFAIVVFFGLARMSVFLPIALVSLVAIEVLSPHNMDVAADFGVLRGLAGFFAGAATYRLLQMADGMPRPGWRLATAIEVIALGAAIIFLARARMSMLAYAAPAVFSVLVLVYSLEGGLISRLLRNRPMLLLGQWSYSIYLTHFVIIYLTVTAAEPLATFLPLPDLATIPYFGEIATLIFMVVTVVVSSVTYRYVERPGQDVAKRLAIWSRRAFSSENSAAS